MFGRCSTGPLIREINQVTSDPIAKETVVSVQTARVVCANYDAIVHDFPQVFSAEARRKTPLIGCDVCAASNRLCPQAINSWLIRNSAFVSEQQLLPNAVNSPINVGAAVRTAYRPPTYGRAVIVPIDAPDNGEGAQFLDLKGVGVAPGKIASHQSHSNGLEYLGWALADFFYGWLIDTIFARTFPDYHIVPVYAVLDLGFDIVNGKRNGTAPAGLHVRRAHSRPIVAEDDPKLGSDRERLMLHVEMLLRSVGLSTTNRLYAYQLVKTADGDEFVYLGKTVPVTTERGRQKAAALTHMLRGCGVDYLQFINVQLADNASWSEKTLQMYDFGQINAHRDFVYPLANRSCNSVLGIGRTIDPNDAAFVRPNDDFAVDPDICNRRCAAGVGFYAAQEFRNNRIDQRSIESTLRIARLKALRRSFAWATRRSGSAALPLPSSKICATSIWRSLG